MNTIKYTIKILFYWKKNAIGKIILLFLQKLHWMEIKLSSV